MAHETPLLEQRLSQIEAAMIQVQQRLELGSSSETWDRHVDELVRIRNLKDDWDGEGSPAPPTALVDGAIALAQKLMANRYRPADRVSASVNGTVYFEWHTPVGYQEIEVTSPAQAEYRSVQKDANVTEVVILPN